MKQRPILSVITPVYNTAQHLPQCLDSVIASISHGNADIEMILVDDGSTDGCSGICDSYALKYPFIRCIHQENAGVSAARNAGLGLANGDYIAWIDSDDTVAKDWFPQIYDIIAREAPDAIVFDSIRLESGRRIPEQYGRTGGVVAKETMLDDIARDIRMLSNLWNKVIKASCYRGIRFGTEVILEDYSRIFSILETAETFFYIPRFLYFYWQREDSLVHSSTPEQSFFCVNAAIRRKEMLYPKYQTAATTGVAVQVVRFCWARANDTRYLPYQKEYRFCLEYLRHHIGELMHDSETPNKWKLKFMLLRLGLYTPLLKMRKAVLGRRTRKKHSQRCCK